MKLLKNNQLNLIYDTIIIPVDDTLGIILPMPENIAEAVTAMINKTTLKETCGEIHALSFLENGNIFNIILLILDNCSNISNRDIFISFSKAFSKCRDLKSAHVRVLLDNVQSISRGYNAVEKICESAFLANYEFNHYKTSVNKNTIETIVFDTDFERFEEALNEAVICSESTSIARDLINHPPMFMTPGQLALEASNIGKKSNFEVLTMGIDEIEKLGMNAFLAVGKGSVNSARLIVMKYMGNEGSNKIIGLIGKGLMYDSGGYCLKSASSLPTMHGDMAGSAAVIGAMRSIAQMNLKVNVVGIIAACENRISDEAYLPGDILKSMAGKYIEMNNSDAEGRLTLVDAITYAIRKENVSQIIDIATLTGSVVTALGNRTAGILSNDDELADKAYKASKIACEKIWRLPLDKELRHALDSCVADLRNSTHDSGHIGGGTIMGGLFIEEFVENIPWLHIDIVGTGWTSENLPYCKKGGLGYGTSLLYNIIKLMSN